MVLSTILLYTHSLALWRVVVMLSPWIRAAAKKTNDQTVSITTTAGNPSITGHSWVSQWHVSIKIKIIPIKMTGSWWCWCLPAHRARTPLLIKITITIKVNEKNIHMYNIIYTCIHIHNNTYCAVEFYIDNKPCRPTESYHSAFKAAETKQPGQL